MANSLADVAAISLSVNGRNVAAWLLSANKIGFAHNKKARKGVYNPYIYVFCGFRTFLRRGEVCHTVAQAGAEWITG